MRGSTVATIFATVFGIIIAANAVMIWLAISSAPGLVTEHPFERGRAYNAELAAAAAQDALGWKAAVEWRDGVAEVHVTTRAGAPVEGLSATITALRPLGHDAPLELTLAETGPGRYAAALPLPRPGQWDLEFVARRGTDLVSATKRIFVR